MKEELLREFVGEVISEINFSFKNSEPKKKKKQAGIWSKIKGLFSRNQEADQLSDDWIEDQELYGDVELPDDLKEKIRDFVRAKYPAVASRLANKPDKLDKVFRRALDTKFSGPIRQIMKSQEQSLLDDEDDEEERYGR